MSSSQQSAVQDLKSCHAASRQDAGPPKPRGASRFAPPSDYDEPPPPSTSSRKMVEPPTRVNRPPGLFEVERREERRQASRMDEDR